MKSVKLLLVVLVLVFVAAITACNALATKPTSQQQVTQDKTVWYLDVEKFYGSDRHAAACAAQGLANRTGPKVFLNTGDKHWVARFHDNATHLSKEVLEKYRGSDDVWKEYYANKHGFEFKEVETADELAKNVGDAIKGIIIYNLGGPGEALVGWTMAGIYDAIPVTEAMLKDSPYLKSLPVLQDIRGRFKTDFQAQQWAFDNLMPRCTKKAVFSRPRSIGIDLGVAQKTLFFNLDYMKVRNPEQAALIDKILGSLEPLSPVYGWGTSEKTMLNRMAQHGVFLQCTDSPNLSFHNVVKPLDYKFKHPRRMTAKDVKLENKYYVTYIGNEGDTLKQLASLQRGSWLNPERGKVPFNWGSCPWVYDNYPAIAEYYYDDMTENDAFCSVIGYAFYSAKYQVELDKLCEAERKSNRKYDISGGTMYSSHGCIPATNGIWDKLTDRWVTGRGCDGYIFECSQQPNLQFSSQNQPIIGMDWKFFYWWHRFDGNDIEEKTNKAVEYMKKLADQHEPPFFLPVYGGTPDWMYEFTNLLPKDKFKVVLIDEMIAAAKVAGQVHLADDVLNLPGRKQGTVKLAVRNIGLQKEYDGKVTVKAPAGWKVVPSVWDYSPIPVNSKRETTFKVIAPSDCELGAYKIAFRDSRTGINDILRVNLLEQRKPITKESLAAVKIAKKKTIDVDGATCDWKEIGSDAIELDMTNSKDSNDTNLLIEELPGDDKIHESVMGQEFETSEFLNADAVAFWFDFDGDGLSENGDFTPYLGFSSQGKTDLYCCTLNDPVLVSTYPTVKIATSGKLGSRVIEAAVSWDELEYILKEKFKPVDGLLNAVKEGFTFGCEPYVIDGEVYLDKNYSYGMYRNGNHKGKPDGFDKDSIDIKLMN